MGGSNASSSQSTEERVRELETALAAERAALAAERAALAALTIERDTLRLAYRNAQQELELLRRRLFVAKAERLDTTQLEMELGHKLAALDALNQQLGISNPGGAPSAEGGAGGAGSTSPRSPGSKRKPKGRRDLREVNLPEERIELTDPVLEASAKRIAWEESCQLSWRRGGFVRTVIARAKYRVVDVSPDTVTESTLETVPAPTQLLPRSMASPSLLAHVLSEKFCDGLPFHRQEDRFVRLGLFLDRGTLCRWAEEIGATLGACVVKAMHDEALRTAFCISTDATGVLVQPIRGGDRARRGCRRGHFLVQIADADHVFFEYLPRETSAAIGELFRGFSGYVQADAKSVYDLLFQPPSQRRPPDDGEPDLAERYEVGCWSHCRRKLWETAVTSKDPVAREGVLRIRRIFDLERTWRDKPPDEIRSLRELHLRPHTEAFFTWVEAEYERVKDQRGMLRSALGYAHRQRGPLTRFFDDGRLALTNNRSERELRRVAVGRKAWLFAGSDDHAQAAGNLMSLIASARLHCLDPEAYLRDLIRVVPHWPRGRYLELAPRYWLATRARLDVTQLERELGPLDVPTATASSEQSAAG
jgi:transposase